jgi:predicted lipoprotein
MSVLGVASTGLSQLGNIQSKFQHVQSEFKTLGQDLSAGNLAQAQTDFVTLSQSVTSQLTSSSPVAKAVNAVGQALQAGDLAAAQQAFASIPSTVTGPSAVHHHRHTPPSQASATFAQEMSTLGQALQSGNLSAAQQAFSAMQQGWQQMQTSGTSATLMPPVSGGVNVTV